MFSLKDKLNDILMMHNEITVPCVSEGKEEKPREKYGGPIIPP